MEDVGKPKAVVAAARVAERVAGVTVTPHVGRIEDKPLEWCGGREKREREEGEDALDQSFLSLFPTSPLSRPSPSPTQTNPKGTPPSTSSSWAWTPWKPGVL
jgi:hypothetical protein